MRLAVAFVTLEQTSVLLGSQFEISMHGIIPLNKWQLQNMTKVDLFDLKRRNLRRYSCVYIGSYAMFQEMTNFSTYFAFQIKNTKL